MLATIVAVSIPRAEAVTSVISFNIGSNFQTPVVSATGLEFGQGQGVVAHGFVDYSLLPGIADDAALAALNNSLTAQNIIDVFNAFQIFGVGGGGTPAISSFATDGAFNAPSAYSVSGSATLQFSNSAGAPFINKNIYTIAGNGTTFGTSTEIFLFKSIGMPPSSPSVYVQENPLPGTSDVNISDQFGANPAQGQILLGNFGLFQSSFGGFTTARDAFSLTVPEPSGALLVVLAGAIPLLRRRRTAP